MEDIDLRLRLLSNIVFAMPWSFRGKSRLDIVWGKIGQAINLIHDYKESTYGEKS